jgi:hypothetical protein
MDYVRRFGSAPRLVLAGVLALLATFAFGAANATSAAANGTISGKVTAGGNPLPGADVTAISTDEVGTSALDERSPDADEPDASATGAPTDTNGDYSLQVEPGQYIVRFDAGSAGNYATQFYDGTADGTLDPAEATKLDVADAETILNIDADLAEGATIEGTVIAQDGGAGLENVCVTAVPIAPSFTPDAAVTESGGTYEITGLPAGAYNVLFDPCPDSGLNRIAEWWDNQPTQTAEHEIDLTAGELQGNIDAALATGGSITGTVTTNDNPIAGARVRVYGAGSEPVEVRTTNDDGDYTVDQLPGGDYRVEFLADGHTPEFHENKPSLEDADIVGVTAPLSTGPIDADLDSDPDPPVVSIASFPTPTNDPTPSFEFSFNEPATAECAFEEAGTPAVVFVPCTSNSSHEIVDPLGDGTYTLTVRGTDLANNFAQSSANITIDTQNPSVSVTGGPTSTTDTTPTFSYDIEPGAVVECSIAAPGFPEFGPCLGQDQHTPTADLALGSYEFAVRATDQAGNAAVASRPFTVVTATPPPPPPPPGDTTPPSIKITSGPAGKITDRRPRFGFSSEDPNASFLCSLDGAPEAPCRSPMRLPKLKKGKHSFAITAVDAAGNRSATEVRTFKVKVKKKKKKRRRK